MANQEKLASSLSARHILMISLGGMVGAGFFIGAAAAILKTGPAVFISYIISGLLVYLINLSIRDLALQGGRESGSFMTQIRTHLGERIGFLAGWAYWLTWVVVLGAEVLFGANMIHDFLSPYGIAIPVVTLEIIVLAVMTAINLMSVKGYGEFEYWFSLIKLIAIGVFVAIALWVIIRGALGLGHAVPIHHNLFDFGGLVPKGWLAVLAVVPTIFFSMNGSEIVTVAALESDDPDGNIVRITRTIAVRIAGFFLVSIALVLVMRPWTTLNAGNSPFLDVLHQVGIPFAGEFVWIVILTAVLSSLNSALYVTSRILFEMSERGDGPKFFLKVDQKSQLPRRAVVACFIGGVLVVLASTLSHDEVYFVMLSLTGVLMLFNNFLIVAARIKSNPEGHFAPYLACVLFACIVVAMAWMPETRLEAGIGIVALSIIAVAALFHHRNTPIGDSSER
ncbi:MULTISPECIES: amino acid permease [unclassified Saccharibacter]|uniref:amino acid permease n=1 Tax=unclassified Saccharibacter TaxID=2648722 RepID=UPI001323201E|nr:MULTISPECIES: amino acid permease [unclassified Saccharibacter]MXV36612.1 amino acid permease [Saccharibacter sp. EH611]MXV58828.1 amino acid permease [Saccharibacter sp. EH70]MXV65484.1 amino acid permease [Saccharibacter sp. EH60]